MNLYEAGTEAAENGLKFEQQNLIVYPIVGTTMTIVRDLIVNGEAERMMRENGADNVTVMALAMTAGVGSVESDTGKTRKWWAGANERGKRNLLFSRALWITSAEYPQEVQFEASLAMAKIMTILLPRATVTIKYPNDLLVDGAKICGCIVPSEYGDDSIRGTKRLVNLGVGLNVGETPPLSAVREKATVKAATSLADHGVVKPLHELMEMFDQLAANGICTHGIRGRCFIRENYRK